MVSTVPTADLNQGIKPTSAFNEQKDYGNEFSFVIAMCVGHGLPFWHFGGCRRRRRSRHTAREKEPSELSRQGRADDIGRV
ncbi:hypothetical protein CUJ84_Chr002870 [Rhizobium leguminosarum]|uniref:Uncharacterized protein n=1 Tax=Rhizobium leguminosarum TaxID=384 RepID=A0A2K9Z4R0_RHILE|nr:hypothetical protein CUJ84_Chr002870 [Rhizobium leguminosarum]